MAGSGSEAALAAGWPRWQGGYLPNARCAVCSITASLTTAGSSSLSFGGSSEGRQESLLRGVLPA